MLPFVEKPAMRDPKMNLFGNQNSLPNHPYVNKTSYSFINSIQFNSLFQFTQSNTILYCLSNYLCHYSFNKMNKNVLRPVIFYGVFINMYVL